MVIVKWHENHQEVFERVETVTEALKLRNKKCVDGLDAWIEQEVTR